MFIEERHQAIFGLFPKEKIGFDSVISICPVERMDVMITDWDASEENLKLFDEKGAEVVVVEQADPSGQQRCHITTKSLITTLMLHNYYMDLICLVRLYMVCFS